MNCAAPFPCVDLTPVWACCAWYSRCGAREPGWLSQRQAGEELDLVGPLGHGFPLMDRNSRAVLVGGGIGTPPLLPLAQRYGSGATAITGFRSGTAAILQDDLAGTGADCRLCTDDGSAGFHGFTTQMLEQRLNEGACDVVYTCGPKVMMKRVAAMALERGIPCYVSMEERMGCGVGACLGCVCGTKAPDGEKKMTRVCLNGPVFDAREVVWDMSDMRVTICGSGAEKSRHRRLRHLWLRHGIQ